MADKKRLDRVEYTKEMNRAGYTILIPSMAPIHFAMLRYIFRSSGYRLEVLENHGPEVVQEGLKYVHNDTCYPALLVIGQMMDALHSGKYDLQRTALMITQTGGGCRASNYIFLLRKALKKAGLGHIPVISLNLSGLEKNSGFTFTLSMLRKLVACVIYGDAMMHLYNQVRPYECAKGAARQVVDHWTQQICQQFDAGKGVSIGQMRKNLAGIAAGFAAVPVKKVSRVKVGVVGEIYVKYASLGNNDLEAFLRSQGCEYMVPGILGFALFKVDNRLEDIRLYGGNPAKYAVCRVLMKYLTDMERELIGAIARYPQFVPPSPYAHTKGLVKGVIGYGSKMGEGWLLTAEMMELAELGYGNVVCTQPFGCLPNHINGKGMIRRIKELYPESNIVPIDYDPSATRVNQENRIKLMLAVAREELARTTGEAPVTEGEGTEELAPA